MTPVRWAAVALAVVLAGLIAATVLFVDTLHLAHPPGYEAGMGLLGGILFALGAWAAGRLIQREGGSDD